MKIYEDFYSSHEAVWFSTDSHTSGMGRDRKKEFLKAIKEKEIV